MKNFFKISPYVNQLTKPLLLLIVIIQCVSCSQKKSDKITKTWTMCKVIQSGEDVSSEHNPFQERIIIFNKDGRFETNGRPYGKNTGKYSFNKQENTLHLDSDIGPEDDSNWKVSFKEDSMFWQGFGTRWAEEFVLVYAISD